MFFWVMEFGWVMIVFEHKIFVRVSVTCECIAANAEPDAELNAQNKI